MNNGEYEEMTMSTFDIVFKYFFKKPLSGLFVDIGVGSMIAVNNIAIRLGAGFALNFLKAALYHLPS